MFLGWHDIRQRYRRSVLGPFWLTISTAVLIGGLGLMYSEIFHLQIAEYLPYLSVGLIVWNFIQSVILDSCFVFTGAEGSIKTAQLPISSYVLRLIWRNFVIFLHNSVVLFIVIAWFGHITPLGVLSALAGLLVICFILFWLALLIGLTSARFRDIPQIVTNGTQIIFFLTPVMWRADLLKARAWMAEINPFYYMIELVREPLTTGLASAVIWERTGLFLLGLMAITILAFAKYRKRIVYWL